MLPGAEPALLADRAAGDVQGEEHRQQPAGADRPARRAAAMSISSSSSPRAAAAPTRRTCFQQTPAVLNEKDLETLRPLEAEGNRHERLPAVPPRRSSSAGPALRLNLKTVKLASCRVPRSPADDRLARRPGVPRYRDGEERILQASRRNAAIGAQFGGKYFAHDVRVIRLPRHAASCPIGMGVSCSADRQDQGEDHPGRHLPRAARDCTPRSICPTEAPKMAPPVKIDLIDRHGQGPPDPDEVPGEDAAGAHRHADRRPRRRPRPASSRCSMRASRCRSTSSSTRSTTPAPPRRPQGMPSGSFGPTTAGRMDSFVDLFQSHGGSLVMIAKGNRSKAGHRRLQEARRLLPRLHRRPGRHPGPEQHQEGRTGRL